MTFQAPGFLSETVGTAPHSIELSVPGLAKISLAKKNLGELVFFALVS